MPLTANAALSKDKRTGKSAKFQHRHYAFVANVIANDLGFLSDQERKAVARMFADALQAGNHNFNRERFLLAANTVDMTWITPRSIHALSALLKEGK